MGISVIQQAKIQVQVLVPLVKALQEELGDERANSLVRGALGDLYRRYGEAFWRAKNEKNFGKFIGVLLVCSADFTTAEGFGPDVELTCTQTIMQGASHCDFRYRRLKEVD